MHRFPALFLVVVVVTSGCATMKNRLPDLQPKMLREKTEATQTPDQPRELGYGNPERMAIIWKDSVLQGVGSAPTVGFGGRIYFYDQDNQPVRADGELIVYGYDDDQKKSDSAAADRKYVFVREKFQSHYDRTNLGDSYSIWVPWEKVGGIRKRIMLIPVFKRADGKIIQGEQQVTVLPGKEPERDMLAKTDIPTNLRPRRSTVRQVQATSDEFDGIALARGTLEEAQASGERRISSETIELPPYVARRMGQPNQTIDALERPVNALNQKRVVEQPNQGRPVRDLRRTGRLNTKAANDAVDPSAAVPSPRHAPPGDGLTGGSNSAARPSQRPVFGQPGAFGR